MFQLWPSCSYQAKNNPILISPVSLLELLLYGHRSSVSHPKSPLSPYSMPHLVKLSPNGLLWPQWTLSRTTVWTQHKSISHLKKHGPLSPFCSWERESIKGVIVTQVSSPSLTKFILWGWLRHSGQRARHWSELPCSQLLSALTRSSAMITQGSVRDAGYFQLSGLWTRREDCVCHKSVAKLIKIDGLNYIFGFPLPCCFYSFRFKKPLYIFFS